MNTVSLDEAIRIYETMAAREWTNEVGPTQLVKWLKELRFRRQLDKVLAAYKEDQEDRK